ncbi:MAG TPA: argininosuccinate lyase [bacterium]|nr:argininosuccinate lyase [bacterium]
MGRDPRYVEHVLAPRYAFGRREELPYLLDVLVAHTLMLRRQGIVAPQAAAATLRALTAITPEDLPPYDPRYEDIYFAVEDRVAQATGGVGEFRPALSRNDAWAALIRLMLRDQGLVLVEQLDDLREALLAQAVRHRDTLMMAHTHHQYAQPTTVAHYLLAAAATVGRCVDRYRDALGRLDRSPLGAGALTTTGFPIDRDYTAALLGFAGIVENSYDAVAAGDHLAELAGCHAVLATSLGRIVQDLLGWASSEVGALELAAGFIQISSIMPQKRNPVVLEHVRSALSRLLGTCLGVWASAHNVPFEDVNDPADDAVPLLAEAHLALGGTLAVLREAIASAAIRGEAWAPALRGTFATSTELADTLVREGGLGFPEAHASVARLLEDRRRQGRGFAEVTPDEVEAAALAAAGRRVRLSAEAIARAIDPRSFVSSRTIPGGPGAQPVGAMLASAQASLAASREATRAVRDRLAAARARRRVEASA